MNFQIIGFTLGLLLSILGVAELVPAWLEWVRGEPNALSFFLNAVFSLFFGISLVLANKSFNRQMTVRQTFMLTTLSWLFVSFFAAIPLWTSNINISFTDAFFESVSSITTTGSTILSGLDNMSHGVLLWRSIVQWIGGIGLVAFAIIFLPFLRVGGMQLFQTESSDKSEKIMPKSADIMRSLVVVYTSLTIICALAYHIAGMSLFDAINHAMTTIPTGGMSTHDSSFGFFNSPLLDLLATFFMFLGGVPFILFIKFAYQGKFSFFKDEQFVLYFWIVAGLTFVLSLWLWFNSDYSLFQSFVYCVFNIISVITTTGYATTDYSLWGPFAVMFFFFITYIGGCAGSTAGGLKIMRISIISKAVDRQLKLLLYPNSQIPLRYQGNVIEAPLVGAVLGFSALYVMSNVLLTLALSLTGLDFTTAISGAATAIANVGPGLGHIIGPAGNFSTLPDSAKWLLSLGMLVGRLEILTMLVLFTSYYWHR